MTTTTELDLTADIINVRDIMERVEELEGEMESRDDAEAGVCIDAELVGERQKLLDILGELHACASRRFPPLRWRGDWYPQQLIAVDNHPSAWTDYVREMLEDCGIIPKDLPAWVHIDWERTAKDVQVDYTSVDINGRTYFYR